MPVQYVLGEWDFQDLTLKMRPPVFIPRPETEDLVSLVVEEEFQRCEHSALCFPVPVPHPVILEIGCGSGAIALSLLCKLPQGRVIAMDKEEAAVDLTRENAHSYEDLDALDGGDDGMRAIKTILALAPSLLKVSGEVRIFEGQSSNKKNVEESSQERQCRKQESFLRSVFLEVDPRHPGMVEHWLQAHPDLLLTLRAIHKDFCGKSLPFALPLYRPCAHRPSASDPILTPGHSLSWVILSLDPSA
ncbi:hypothetical protein DUI87_23455 [Hirundo rustica rustica]|uniref:Methyltransferase domain-containing protein n=1 Tax=Hirundo rustica rustica TaxID=333673 RepID=A0A3M0JGF3_HIRRU|nr:hypothetical protein DUI87_23455 [Hirundo rustica rustica]